jgi:hypothetical protein
LRDDGLVSHLAQVDSAGIEGNLPRERLEPAGWILICPRGSVDALVTDYEVEIARGSFEFTHGASADRNQDPVHEIVDGQVIRWRMRSL